MATLVAVVAVATRLVGATTGTQLVEPVTCVVIPMPSAVVMVAVTVTLAAEGVNVIESPVVLLVIEPPVICHEYVQPLQAGTEAVRPALQASGSLPMVIVPSAVAASSNVRKIPSILKLG